MALGGIGKRYAQALFDAARAEDVVDQVHDDVVSFARLVESDAAFRRFLSSLRVTKDEKKDLISRAIADRASGLFVKFALLLIDTKRMDDFEDIAKAFVELYEEHAGIVRVGVVTAIELDTEMERKAKQTIERRTGKKAKFVKHVDPGIIGGMIMVAGNQIIDGSIRSQLGELRKQLLESR
jgi:F-type H+-transporting ATPase subunit delta